MANSAMGRGITANMGTIANLVISEDLSVGGETTGVPKVKLSAGTWSSGTTGTLTVTGIGFTPKLVKVSGSLNPGENYVAWCQGVATGTGATYCIFNNSAGMTSSTTAGNLLVILNESGTNYAYLGLTSFDSDGATFEKTKNSSPTVVVAYNMEFFG